MHVFSAMHLWIFHVFYDVHKKIENLETLSLSWCFYRYKRLGTVDHCLAHFFKTLPAFILAKSPVLLSNTAKGRWITVWRIFFKTLPAFFLVKSPVLHANTHNDDDSLALQSLDIVPTLALQSRDIMPTTPLHHQGAWQIKRQYRYNKSILHCIFRHL